MMIKTKLTLLFLITIASVQAQNLTDALRYSQLTSGGSARVMGAGGAFGALGGDFGVTSLNVSGIADYRSSEVMMSLSYNNAATETTRNDETVGDNDNGNELILENLAFIKHVKPYNNMATSNWAFGIQQYSNYNQVFSYDTEAQGSIADRFSWLANTDNYGAYEAELADNAGAIFYDAATDSYVNDLTGSEVLNKNETVERSGKVNEFLVSWAGMWESGLRIGAGLGIPFVDYEESKFYEENDTDGSPEGFNKLNYNQSLSTSGIGFNLKVGVGYSIMEKLRIGLAAQTPTFFRLDDGYSTSIVYNCGDCLEENALYSSEPGYFEYRLRTPGKITGSIGYLLVTDDVKGFINLDAQLVDYTANKFNFSYNDPGELDYENQVNGEIGNELKSVINYNLGAELAYKKIRVRSGVSLLASPFFVDNSYDQILSAGLGYRWDKVFIDFAYQRRGFTEGYIPYLAPTEDRDLSLLTDTKVNKFVLTLGIKL